MRIVAGGVDYSLLHPAICVSAIPVTYERAHFYYLTDRKAVAKTFERGRFIGAFHKPWLTAEERYSNIAQWALMCLDDATRIAIEDYSMGSKGRVFHIAENTGHLKMMLYQKYKPFVTIPPTVLKKYATGKGNADKQRMYSAFKELTGKSLLDLFEMKTLSNPVTDIVDAFYITKFIGGIAMVEDGGFSGKDK